MTTELSMTRLRRANRERHRRITPAAPCESRLAEFAIYAASSMEPLDWITIRDLRVNCVIGIFAEEDTRVQPVSVTLRLGLGAARARQIESLEDSVDYLAIAGPGQLPAGGVPLSAARDRGRRAGVVSAGAAGARRAARADPARRRRDPQAERVAVADDGDLTIERAAAPQPLPRRGEELRHRRRDPRGGALGHLSPEHRAGPADPAARAPRDGGARAGADARDSLPGARGVPGHRVSLAARRRAFLREPHGATIKPSCASTGRASSPRTRSR